MTVSVKELQTISLGKLPWCACLGYGENFF
jgi:hypothetical protein